METDEFNELFSDVRHELSCDIRIDDEVLNHWGYSTIRQWVQDYVNQGHTDAKLIAVSIVNDYYNCEH